MVRTSTVKQHPRRTKKGRTTVKRHKRRRKEKFTPKQKRETKILDARMTKSFEVLAKDGRREYGTGMDLDKGTNKRYIEKTDDVYRGKTSSSGRASTKVPEGTDVTIHTHPKHGTAIDKYNRPSGFDIYNMMYRSLSSGDLDEAYIIGPDRTWYRYYIDADNADQEYRLWVKLRRRSGKQFDREVEGKYWSIYQIEKRIAHFDSKDRIAYLNGSVSDRRYFLNHSEKNQKRSAMRKYSGETNRDRIASRRASKEFTKWIYNEWRVRIEKVPKNKDKSISMSYIPDD